MNPSLGARTRLSCLVTVRPSTSGTPTPSTIRLALGRDATLLLRCAPASTVTLRHFAAHPCFACVPASASMPRRSSQYDSPCSAKDLPRPTPLASRFGFGPAPTSMSRRSWQCHSPLAWRSLHAAHPCAGVRRMRRTHASKQPSPASPDLGHTAVRMQHAESEAWIDLAGSALTNQRARARLRSVAPRREPPTVASPFSNPV